MTKDEEIKLLKAQLDIVDLERSDAEVENLRLHAWCAKARALLKTCFNRDSDNHGYGLFDDDRKRIVKLLGEEPTEEDKWGHVTYKE